jgi:hypothetical protein
MFLLPYVGIDLDKCRNAATGQVEEWARAVIRELNSYTEVSPSGTGVHILVRGELPPGRNRAGRVEMYSKARYFTMTGKRLKGVSARIEERDLTSIHSRLGTLDPKHTVEPVDAQPKTVLHGSNKFDSLMAGHWEGVYPSQSEADQAFCVMLAYKHDCNRHKIEEEFGRSGLNRGKWENRQDYRGKTIQRAIEFANQNPRPDSGQVHFDGIGNLPVLDLSDEKEDDQALAWPQETLEGDHIAEYTHLLTDRTQVPPQFVREIVKTSLGALQNQSVGFPKHDKLVTRQYTHLVSRYPQGGKDESWRRVTQEEYDGMMRGLIKAHGFEFVDGSVFGSGQYIAQVLENHPKCIAYFSEGKELFEKNKHQGSTLETTLLKLFDSGQHWSGSYTNKKHGGDNFQLSMVACFTRDGFEDSFGGRGSGGNGYLSRCALAYSEPIVPIGAWRERDTEAEREVVSKLAELIPSGSRWVPPIDADAWKLFEQFWRSVDDPNSQFTHYNSRIVLLTKQDILQRAVYSGSKRITREHVERGIVWGQHQLELRQALWPFDRGSLVEGMERKIESALAKARRGANKGLTLARLHSACNVERLGSGGIETFNRAFRALTQAGRVKPIGKTRKGTVVYGLADTEE